MFVACGIWCLADVSSVSPSSKRQLNTISHRRQTYHINLADQTHIWVTYIVLLSNEIFRSQSKGRLIREVGIKVIFLITSN